MENLKEGFRFRPTDAEAITFLLRFIAGKAMNDSGFITTNVNTYSKQLEPWDIYSHGVPCDNDDGDNDCSQYRFFITKLKKKSEFKYSRIVGNKGSWKQQDKSKPVRNNGGIVIGYKKSMSYVNKGYNQDNGHWLMKEYDLSTKILDKFDNDCRDYVLCAIKKRTPTKDDTMTLMTTVSEECRNLEHQTSAAVESTSYDEALVVDARELQSELQNNMHKEADMVVEPLSSPYTGTNIVIEPLSTPYTFEGTNIVAEPLPAPCTFEGTNIVVEPLRAPYTFEGTNIIVEPLPAPYTFESTSMLDFDYDYSPADFGFLQSIIASF
ncbi:NAC domain-containing protein 78-like [Solanum dulcamara]|uniref:NAC domain-containing protein 78-like n=1 Tax=Solanum dulcamara TaxID=45834 RepID=UPI0024852903|nr:NAC domain-containing protein 78-like [Solanum dulcamara]